jgi:pimeloyl-ACP methyl ester carboxylesterase
MKKLFDHPDLNERQLRAQINPTTGNPVFFHTLTECRITDVVDCVIPIVNVLPIIFVPGIMGSNLKSIKTKSQQSKAVWRLDSGGGAMFSKMFKTAGDRQNLLHPGRTEVDDGGALPETPVGILSKPEHFAARYWGEVSSINYQEFLIWLEVQLNGAANQAGGAKASIHTNHSTLNAVLGKVQDGKKQWGAKKDFVPLSVDEGKQATQWFYPVYACGYNWLGDNADSAKALAARITAVIKDNKRQFSVCEQVILVTHSMGGLVARVCSMLPDMEKKIAGVVHGVMPAAGAAVAYRRCKVGMKDEGVTGMSLKAVESWGGNLTIGNTGPEITAVFAQAPGALQLLPTTQYPDRNWLQVCDTDGAPLPSPDQPKTDDPYKGVYAIQDKWWGLIKTEWLLPPGGTPIDWAEYGKYLKKASDFHTAIQNYYHPNTWGFYGSRVASFAQIRWTLHSIAGDKYATHPRQDTAKLTHTDIPQSGTNPEDILGKPVVLQKPGREPVSIGTVSHQLRLGAAEDSGDGTVPIGSGLWPASPVQSSAIQQCVKQFFEVPGVEHEPAYKSSVSQHITAYAIGKIAAKLPLPNRV